MNAAELLGGLLGRKSGSGGGGGLLKDLIEGALKQQGGGASRAPSQPSQRAPRRRSTGDLGDFVREALGKFQKRKGGSRASTGGGDAHCNDPSHRGLGGSSASELDDAKAVVLIRAMINAAKSDGQLDKNEQDAIVKQLGTLTQEEIDFLKKEFAAPLNVRDYAWSVPLGLEEQVYGLSLMAINLDQNKEASYLRELAHGLRLQPDECNQIHKHYKAPLLYR